MLKSNTKNIVFIAASIALMAIGAWISIPTVVPFTLQTLAIFVCVSLIGGKRGTIAVAAYILLGAVGIPVFSGFKGGFGVLLGPTGGYILGFIFIALVMWLFEHFFGKKFYIAAISMFVGLIICYVFGTAWFMIMYAMKGNPMTLLATLGYCVFPFIIPDIAKIIVATAISQTLRKVLPGVFIK